MRLHGIEAAPGSPKAETGRVLTYPFRAAGIRRDAQLRLSVNHIVECIHEPANFVFTLITDTMESILLSVKPLLYTLNNINCNVIYYTGMLRDATNRMPMDDFSIFNSRCLFLRMFMRVRSAYCNCQYTSLVASVNTFTARNCRVYLGALGDRCSHDFVFLWGDEPHADGRTVLQSHACTSSGAVINFVEVSLRNAHKACRANHAKWVLTWS
jgi:hypothetical protein